MFNAPVARDSSFILPPSSLLDQSRESVQHPSFRPAHVWRAHGMKATSLIVKEAVPVAQVLDSPAGNPGSQIKRAGIKPMQINQSRDRGAGRVRVRRIEPVSVVLGPAVRKKEALAPELVTKAQGSLGCFNKFSVRLWPRPTSGEGLGRGGSSAVLSPYPLSASGEGERVSCSVFQRTNDAR